MEDKLQIFNNVEFGQIRTVIKDNVVWFVGKDVAEALGYSDTNKAVAMHVDEEDKQLNDKTSSSFGQRGATIINESGLYSLVLSSKLPSAKKFKRWVTNDVLPTIHKHGAYLTDQKIEEILNDPDTIIKLATDLKAERERRMIVEQRVNELTPKASYYDLVLQNKSLVTISQIAKDYGMSGREMNAKLHDLKVQYKQGSTWLLCPQYQKLGWTLSSTIVINLNDGTQERTLYTRFTQKGRLGLYALLKRNGILPLIERQDAD